LANLGDVLRIGIAGLGEATTEFLPDYVKHPKVKVTVAADFRQTALDRFQQEVKGKAYRTFEEICQSSEVDIVYIATPHELHAQHTLMALACGKHVIVEKPMALNFAECQEMIAACEAAGVPLYVAYYRRAQPRFLKIKELLENKAIGDVRFVSTIQYQKASEDVMDPQNLPWRVQPELAGAGLFFDLASHTLDMLDFLLGPIKSVQGFASNQAGYYQAEDIVTGTYLFESGVHGIGNWCFSAFEDVDVNEIVGSKGKITFSIFGNEPIVLTSASGTEQWSFEPPQHVHLPLVETVMAELTGDSGRCPSSGVTGARTNWVLNEMVKNYYLAD
jgi:predicted dehydrogenase